ncbi:MAG: DsbA family oxidoreductase [Bacteroidota bacterium]
MTIEIWSDVSCPFCYLGKRKLDLALEQTGLASSAQKVWRSFLLNPGLVTDPDISIYDYLVKVKGFDAVQAQAVNKHITTSGEAIGITFRFDNVVVANTMRAHQLLHFAAQQGKQDLTGELLFQANFSDGRNVDAVDVLLDIATKAGLDPDGLEDALADGAFAEPIARDIAEASQLGVHGVPFFVFNRRHAISGAQEMGVFVETIREAGL